MTGKESLNSVHLRQARSLILIKQKGGAVESGAAPQRWHLLILLRGTKVVNRFREVTEDWAEHAGKLCGLSHDWCAYHMM